LRGFFHPFLDTDQNQRATNFKPGISDSHIVDLVEFDRKLRNLLFDALAIFETQFRSILAYYAGQVSPYIHLNGIGLSVEFKKPRPDQDGSEHDEWILKYKESIEKHEANSIVLWHQNNYQGVLPIWAAVELLELGKVSKLFRALDEPIATRVAEEFQMGAIFLKGVVASLNDLRNHVAHHSRVWNFHYPINPPARARKLPAGLLHLSKISDYDRHKLFTRLSLLLWLDSCNSFGIGFKARLFELLYEIPKSKSITYLSMGYTKEFSISPIWEDFV